MQSMGFARKMREGLGHVWVNDCILSILKGQSQFSRDEKAIQHLQMYIHLSGCSDTRSDCEGYVIPTWSCSAAYTKRVCKKSCNLCDG